MTTPLSPSSPDDDQTGTDRTDADAPTEVFVASPLAGDASATETTTENASENASENPTIPSPAAQEPDLFAPNSGAPATATPPHRLRPRFGTILWGILLFAFAVYMVVFTLLPVAPDPTLWLLGGVIAVGLGLVVAGIAAVARRAD